LVLSADVFILLAEAVPARKGKSVIFKRQKPTNHGTTKYLTTSTVCKNLRFAEIKDVPDHIFRCCQWPRLVSQDAVLVLKPRAPVALKRA